jgi:hypothetical protein
MRRFWAALLVLSPGALGGCVYHFPELQRTKREGRQEVPLLESAGYAVASVLLTTLVHELGHAAMGEAIGAEDIEIHLLSEGHLGFTRMRGDFSEDNLRFLDVAGLLATYGLGEVMEALVFENVIPERAQPFFATWTLFLKADLYMQVAQSPFVESSDLAKFSDSTGFPEWGYLGLVGTELLFHHGTYLELWEEARTFRPEPDE